MSVPAAEMRLPIVQARLPVSVAVLTCNEEENIGTCLRSVAGWAGEIFVVDSGSTDRTAAIAEELGARVVFHPFETHTRQWRWALDHLPFQYDWILALDADQRVSPELAADLRRRFAGVATALAGVAGFYMTRRQMFRGRWIRHGGYYPKQLLKLFRRSAVALDPADLVDHHFYVAGPAGWLRGDLIEENRREDDIGFWIAKHTRYVALMAAEELLRKSRCAPAPLPAPAAAPERHRRRLKWCWDRLPLYVRPFLYFGYRYVFRLGFLDGPEGLIFHFLHACWFRLMVDIKLEELLKRSRADTSTGTADVLAAALSGRAGE